MTLRIFESVFYKSLIRACSFDNSLAASQNARSYVQTIDHRALRICKKRIQKVLMLSSFFLINISSYLLSDSYNGTLFKSLHSVYVKRYLLISFIFVNGRWKIFYHILEIYSWPTYKNLNLILIQRLLMLQDFLLLYGF